MVEEMYIFISMTLLMSKVPKLKLDEVLWSHDIFIETPIFCELKSHIIYVTLLQPYLDQGHSIYVNWYSSPTLFLWLYDKFTNAYVTVKRNRTDISAIAKQLKRNRIGMPAIAKELYYHVLLVTNLSTNFQEIFVVKTNRSIKRK